MDLRRAALPLLAIVLASCATYREELVSTQRAFDKNDHDRTLALLRDLEPDMERLQPAEKAQYCYLRGMTDYRIGHRKDARHWLALAKAYDDASPGLLAADWKARTHEALDDLNGEVYADVASWRAAHNKK